MCALKVLLNQDFNLSFCLCEQLNPMNLLQSGCYPLRLIYSNNSKLLKGVGDASLSHCLNPTPGGLFPLFALELLIDFAGSNSAH